jgi:co-chaperonin GroES (HSP10)
MMKWFDRWLYGKVRNMWDNSQKYEEDIYINKTKAQRGLQLGTAMAIEKGRAEGEDRITFELSTAVGGRILNVRRYDTRTDRHDSQTYVIPSGEDVGARVAKILNLELIK